MIGIGQRLKEIRISQGMSLEEVSEATKIRASFLSAIEKGEYRKLPSSSYAQGFVQNYATFLGIPKKEAMALFRREFDEKKVYSILPEGFVKEKKVHHRSIKIHQALFLVLLLLILLGGFLFYQYRAAFISPSLVISEPSFSVTQETEVVVAGKVEQNSILTINNSPVTINKDGSFLKRVSVFSGKNTILIKAKNSFGKETIISKDVTVKSSQ
ncbi:MAG: helix-turn-helix domain-containing protein [Candidatus Levybacteria bacterium]|nr:helix-turn-helix domain-containing protein [Candidatus Levybacteria bacterium]